MNYIERKSPKDETTGGDPCRNLWSSVMTLAIKHYRLYKPNSEWFFISEQSNFEWICHHLNLEPEVVRTKVLRYY